MTSDAYEVESEPGRTLEFLAEVERATRSRLRLFWFPMLVFGLIQALAALPAALWGPEALGAYWLLLAPVGTLICLGFYRRTEYSIGLAESGRPYAMVIAALAAGNFTLPMIVQGDPGWATTIWTGLCYLGFARLERSAPVLATALTLITIGVAVAFLIEDNGSVITSVAVGATLLAGGFYCRKLYVKQ